MKKLHHAASNLFLVAYSFKIIFFVREFVAEQFSN